MFRLLMFLSFPVFAHAQLCPELTPAARTWIAETAHVTRLTDVQTLAFTPNAASAPFERAALCHLENLRTLKLENVEDLARAATLADLPPRLETLIVNAPTVTHLCTREGGCPLANLLVKRLTLAAPEIAALPAGALPIGLRHLALVGDRTRRVDLGDARGLSELLSLRTLHLDGFETAALTRARATQFAAR